MKIDTDINKIREILDRGVEEIVDREHLEQRLKSGEQLRIKLGIDPTGPKIHIGRAIILWKLKAFQELGHQIILIIGDFTAKVGDASDKESMRKCLTDEEIKANMRDYQQQLGLILDMSKVELRYNSEWLGQLNFGDILGLATNFTAQQMIQRRNFKERWENANPIGLHELLYPLMQGYDSVAIKADVEMGGFDQLFNLKAGREIQRAFNQPAQDIMTLKMLNGLDGRKMSTSWGNVITILDEPEDMFGKVMSLRDEMMPDYFELCTDMPQPEVDSHKKALEAQRINPRDIKALLAFEIVKRYHGEAKAKAARQEFDKIFRNKELPTEIPEFKVQKAEYPILDLLSESGLAPSKSEAKRLVLGKAVEINNEIKDDWKEVVKLEEGMIIKAGKRKFVKIKF